jgi:diguanylate cyclase (GGDEF)-like protein
VPQTAWWRPALACLLGLLGLVFSEPSVELQLEAAPSFAPGGAFVFASFVGLGTGPGLLSALIAALPLLTSTPQLGPPAVLFALLRIAEPWGTCLLYRRFGSLVFAAAVYWLSAGLLLDLFLLGVGLPLDLLALLFVRQLFRGLWSGLLAEVLLRVPAVASLLPGHDSLRPASLQHYVFNRVVLVAALPALVLALLFTRTAYDGVLDRLEARTTATAREARALVRASLREREAALQRLARQVEMDWAAGRGEAPARLLALQPAPAGFDDVSFVTADGRVLARSPGGRYLSETAPGTDLGTRAYFRQTRSGLRPASSSLVLTSGETALSPAVVVVEALFDPAGDFRGALVASFDPRALVGLLAAADHSRSERVSLLDAGHTVLTSLDPELATGDSLRGFLPAPSSFSATAPRFTWTPPGAAGPARRMGLHTRRAAYERLEPGGYGLLVDRPGHETRRDLLPVAGRVLALFTLMLLLLHRVVARFAHRVSGPLLAIDEASGDIAEGHFPDQESLLRLFRSPIAEIRSVAYRFLTMRDALAYRDALTGLPNRALFKDRLAQALAQVRRDRQRLAVLRLGIDRFRLVLDTLGHAAGDALLVAVAARLRGPVRESDTVARLAADEFGVLVRHTHEVGETARMADLLLEAVRAPVTLEGREIVVTASVGIALYPGDGDRDELLLQNADAAMHRAKAAGGDTYRLYAPTMNDRAQEQLALEGELRRALGQGEFEVHYQPIVDLRTSRLAGVEALVRWRHPERGLVLPRQFIGLAEVSGLIVPIGSFVLREAAARVKTWHDLGYGPLRLEVNLSARQFQKPDLVEEVSRCLEETGLPPEALELEITESTAMHDVEASVSTLEALRARGVRISLDDFGTGYSSLGYLKTLPVDTVKLDQSFVRDVTSDRGDAAIATAVLSLARSLDLGVIAEGVESHGQVDFLWGHGCHTMQGFFFSPPLHAVDLELRLGAGVCFVPELAS